MIDWAQVAHRKGYIFWMSVAKQFHNLGCCLGTSAMLAEMERRAAKIARDAVMEHIGSGWHSGWYT